MVDAGLDQEMREEDQGPDHVREARRVTREIDLGKYLLLIGCHNIILDSCRDRSRGRYSRDRSRDRHSRDRSRDRGKYSSLIGCFKMILTSDWLFQTGTAETDPEIDIERGKMTNIGTNIEVTFDSYWFIQYLLISDWLKQ